MAPKLGLFVLCYNVGTKIGSVLGSIPLDVMDQMNEVIVIDNNSQDDTIAQAQTKLTELGLSRARILKNVENYGYGGSHKVAFDAFQASDVDFAILLHGDGQGTSPILRKIVDVCVKGEHDLVMGSRFMKGNELNDCYPFHRKIANQLLIALQSAISGLRLTDPASPQMAYSMKLVKAIPYRQLTDGFHFTPQFVLYASRFPLRVYEFPMPWGKVEITSVNIWEHGWRMVSMLLGYRLFGVKLFPQDRNYPSLPA